MVQGTFTLLFLTLLGLELFGRFLGRLLGRLFGRLLGRNFGLGLEGAGLPFGNLTLGLLAPLFSQGGAA